MNNYYYSLTWTLIWRGPYSVLSCYVTMTTDSGLTKKNSLRKVENVFDLMWTVESVKRVVRKEEVQPFFCRGCGQEERTWEDQIFARQNKMPPRQQTETQHYSWHDVFLHVQIHTDIQQ